MIIKDSIFGIKETAHEAQWGDVFCVSKTDNKCIDELVKKNKSIYDNLDTEALASDDICDNIRLCVENALEEGNHALFAKYLLEILEKKKYDEDTLVKRFFNMLNEKMRNNGISARDLVVFKESKGNYWRDSDYTIKNANVGILYKEKNINKKIKGESINKDTAVQIGLQIGLNSKEINKWLKIVGGSGLYILDIVDCIGHFYLDYYSNLDNERKTRDPEYTLSLAEGKERLIHVKQLINEYIIKIDNRSDKLSEEKSKIIPKQIEGKGLAYGSDVIQYNKDSHFWNIHKYISDLDKEYKINRSDRFDNSLTIHFSKAFQLDCEDKFFEMIKNNLSVFIQVKYSFYAKTTSYIDDVDSMKKNFLFYANKSDDGENLDYYSGTELSLKSLNEIDRIINIQKKEAYPPITLKHIEEFNRNGKLKNVDSYIFLVSFIYGISNCLEYLYYDKYPSKNDLYHKLRGDGKKENRLLREFSKNDVVKFAVSTGHENDIGQLMLSGCYWDIDLMNNELSSEYISRDGFIDALDVFVIYSYMYRNQLIDEWIKGSSDINQDALRLDYQKRFPMVALMAIISRDIQFVLGYIKNNKYEFKNLYKDFSHASVFRTVDSTMKWFNEDIYPSEKKARLN